MPPALPLRTSRLVPGVCSFLVLAFAAAALFPDRVAGYSKMSRQIVLEAALMVLRLRFGLQPTHRSSLRAEQRQGAK